MPRDPRLNLRKVLSDKETCATCQYNLGDICAGFGERSDNGELTFGMPIEETKAMFPQGCEEYTVSAEAYQDQSGKEG